MIIGEDRVIEQPPAPEIDKPHHRLVVDLVDQDVRGLQILVQHAHAMNRRERARDHRGGRQAPFERDGG